MSPASQGSLEVERYIGSYLISSSVRSSVGGKSLLPGISKKQQEGITLRGKQQRDYLQQGNYPSKKDQCPYGTWAGTPLISMTPNQRRNNQRSSPPPCQNQQQSLQPQPGQQIQTHMQNHIPLSRLAIHTQGAPLILAGKFHNRGKIQSCNGMNGTPMNNTGTNILNNSNGNLTNYCNGNVSNNAAAITNSIVSSAGKCISARGQSLSEPARKLQSQQQQQHLNPKTECTNVKADGANIANIDSLSIASDESSGSNNSENSLPRIIKPRKRRKKDRKPTGTGVTVAEIPAKVDDHQQQHNHPQQQQQYHQQQEQQQQHHQQQQYHQQPHVQQNIQHQNHSNSAGISDQSSLVTLKPYVPICYEIKYEQNRGHRRPQPISKESYPHSPNQNISCNGSMQHLNQQQLHHHPQKIVDTRQHHHQHQQQQQQPQQHQRYLPRPVQEKVLDHNKNVVAQNAAPNMSDRSTGGLSSKGTAMSSSNYHIRNYRHHAAHPHHYHHHHHHHLNESRINNNNNAIVSNCRREITHSTPRHRFSQQHQSHQQLHAPHDYEPMLMGCEDSGPLVVGASGSLESAGCQCRYCDPSGLIWDVDQNVYSPFLTPPHTSEFPVCMDYGSSQHHQYPHLPLLPSHAGSDITCQDQPASSTCKYFELPESASIASQRGHNNRNDRHQVSCLQGTCCSETTCITACSTTTGNACNAHASSAVTMLRRSWSDPTSYFSEEISVPSRDVGVIGDRGQTEITRGRSSWPGSSSSSLPSGNAGNSPHGNMANMPCSSQGLEVSTEIVTSPNGHRDLEIKFYSSSPSALPAEDDKSAFLEDGEDFSDIWSYHESKLQQDFRTLLQAEE